MSVIQVHDGNTSVDDYLKFSVFSEAMVIVSNQNNDATAFAAVLCARRSATGNADSDYVEMLPSIPLDNNNNYQIILAGDYALKVTTAADIIAVVHE